MFVYVHAFNEMIFTESQEIIRSAELSLLCYIYTLA